MRLTTDLSSMFACKLDMRASRKGAWRLTQVFALGVLLLLPALPAFTPAGRDLPGTTVPATVNIADGLYTKTTELTVNGTPFWTNFNCPSQVQFGWCVDPVAVAYIPTTNLVVISEAHCPLPGCNGTHDSLVEYDPVTQSYSSPLLLNCWPETPYYPGTGDEYLVPCWNYSQNWRSVLAVDYQTNSIVANISDPAGVYAMAYVPSTGMVVGGGSNGLEVINPTAGVVESTMQVPNATFSQVSDGGVGGSYTLVYDAATNSLIVPTTTNKLLSVDPNSGTIEAAVSLPAALNSLAIDPATNQLLVATVNSGGQNPTYAGTFLVLNARTFASEIQFPIPHCAGSFCGQGFIEQILADPSHGDAYLVANYGVWTLNLSTLSIVDTIPTASDGFPQSSAYVPSTDQILLTYDNPMTGPGLLVQLHRGSITVWTSFLWMPPTYGELTIVLLVAIVVAIVVWVQVRAWRSHRKRPESNPVP
jgi:hypothetical protein